MVISRQYNDKFKHALNYEYKFVEQTKLLSVIFGCWRGGGGALSMWAVQHTQRP